MAEFTLIFKKIFHELRLAVAVSAQDCSSIILTLIELVSRECLAT